MNRGIQSPPEPRVVMSVHTDGLQTVVKFANGDVERYFGSDHLEKYREFFDKMARGE